MRHTRLSFAVALVMLVSLGFAGSRGVKAAPASAGIPGTNFSTAFRVQNLDASSPASCSYIVYRPDGTQAFSQQLPSIAVNESAYVYTPQVAGFPTGTFGAVISCNVQVAAVVNYSDPTKGDTYVGVSNPTATQYIPSAYNNYFNFFTLYQIMNASSARQTVNIDYYAPGNATSVGRDTVTLDPNGSAQVDQNGKAFLQRNVAYSAKVSGTGALAVTVSIYGQGATINQLYAFTAFGDGTTNPIYAPVIMSNYYGYNSAVTIQNLDAAEADVDIQYTSGTTKNVKIAGNSSQVVLNFQEPSLSRNVLYSAKIVSKNGKKLIVTVNESSNFSRASTYEGTPTGGRKQVAPVVMYKYFSYNSSITCQNIGTAATQISISYTGTNRQGQPVTVNGDAITVQPGQTGFFFQFLANQHLPAGFIGSASLNAASSDIVCVVNQDQNEAPQSTQQVDQLYAYGSLIKP